MLDVEGDPLSVLFVGTGGVAENGAAVLERAEFSVETCAEAAACLDRAAADVDCVVSTYRLDGTDGVTLLRAVREEHPDLPFVLVAREGDETVASEAIRADVTDYVPVEEGVPADLAERVDDAIATRETSDERFRTVFEQSHDAIFITDPYADEILDANPAGCEMLGYTKEELLSLGPSDSHPNEMDRFEAFVDGVFERGEGWTDELTCRTSDGRRLPVELSASRIEIDGRPLMLANVRDVSERSERERALNDTYELLTDGDLSFEETVDSLLSVARRVVGTDYATLSHIEDDTCTFELVDTPAGADIEAGDTVELGITNCERVAAREETLVLRDVEAEAPDLAERAGNAEWGISSYLGAPVQVDGEVYGTLCFYDMEARAESFAEWEVTFVELLSSWIGQELERRRDADRIAALDDVGGVVHDINRELARQSSREEIERVVCERLADSDSYEFAWIGTVDERTREVVPSTVVDGQGYLEEVTITADESDIGRGPTGTALRTGETQVVGNVEEADAYDPWRERAVERGISSSAAVPIVYEGQSYGVLNVYSTRTNAFDDKEREVVGQLGEIMGLSVAVLDRERELAHERKRLEFVNRLVRHDLLNSLNVVQARANILEPHVPPEGMDHLERVQDRTSGMTDLIETLRSLMQAVVERNEYELERVDLDDVLESEVRQAEQRFDRAVFEVHSGVEEGPDVVADDLLAEVFENLLTNAVQHNDADVPRVVVDVEPDAETVTVRVADNGPGIPDDLESRIFEKGAGDLGDPGTGFGLYLVREIVDTYGGTVGVDGNECGGATVSVTVPRAAAATED